MSNGHCPYLSVLLSTHITDAHAPDQGGDETPPSVHIPSSPPSPLPPVQRMIRLTGPWVAEAPIPPQVGMLCRSIGWEGKGGWKAMMLEKIGETSVL